MAKLLQPGQTGEQKAAMEAIDYKAVRLGCPPLCAQLADNHVSTA